MSITYVKFCPRCQMATALDTPSCPRCGHSFRTQMHAPQADKTLNIPRSVLDTALARPKPPAELPRNSPATFPPSVPSPLRAAATIRLSPQRALAWALATLALLLAMTDRPVRHARPRPRRTRVSRQLVPALLRAAASTAAPTAHADARALPAPAVRPLAPQGAPKFVPEFVFASTPTQRLAPAAPHALLDLQRWLQMQPAPPAANASAVNASADGKGYTDTVRLYLSGRILLVQPGTPARVIDVHGPWRLAAILAGPYRGQTVYVAAAALARRAKEPGR